MFLSYLNSRKDKILNYKYHKRIKIKLKIRGIDFKFN